MEACKSRRTPLDRLLRARSQQQAALGCFLGLLKSTKGMGLAQMWWEMQPPLRQHNTHLDQRCQVGQRLAAPRMVCHQQGGTAEQHGLHARAVTSSSRPGVKLVAAVQKRQQMGIHATTIQVHHNHSSCRSVK